MPPKHNLRGERFGRLTVVRLSDRKTNGEFMWECQCDCGNVTTVTGSNLLAGRVPGRRSTTSCGCWQREKRPQIRLKHGRTGTREWIAWQAMKSRCNNPNVERYPRYGGRGIRVCEQWAESFETFLADMGQCPSGHSLDRINNDGNYEPENCRWATAEKQQAHTSRTHLIAFNGKTMHVSAWAKALGFKREILKDRLRRGWSVERALTEPLKT